MTTMFRKPEISGRWAGATETEQRELIEQAHGQALATHVARELDVELAQNDKIVRDVVRPRLAELANLSTNRRVPATSTKAHLAELTEPQLHVLRAGDNPSGLVSQNGSTGVTRPLIRALDAKGYGNAVYHMTRRHLIIGFEINARGRAAARERFGVPEWVGQQ